MTTVFQRNVFQFGVFQISGVGSVSGVKRRYHKPSDLEKELEEQRPFNRQRFDELRAAERAQEEAERKAKELQASKRKRVLEQAALLAAHAIEVVRDDESASELVQLTSALNAAAGATKAAEEIRQSRIAIAAANAILAEMEDEEEAEMLLLQ